MIPKFWGCGQFRPKGLKQRELGENRIGYCFETEYLRQRLRAAEQCRIRLPTPGSSRSTEGKSNNFLTNEPPLTDHAVEVIPL